jgi:chorismate mutase
MATGLVWGIRGATTVDADEPVQIDAAVLELLSEILERNGLTPGDCISILFTATGDLSSTFPATAARHAGFGDVPLICAQEIPVPGAMERCIRVLLHVHTTRERSALHHVYLRGAKGLRDDLPS